LNRLEPPALHEPTQETGFALLPMLEQMTLAELRDIARQRGWQIKASSKAEYAARLAPLLSEPTEIARAVISLPDNLRRALQAAFVAKDGHGIAPAVLARVMSAMRGDEREMLKAVEAAGLLRDLARWGLVFPWRGFSNGLRHLFPSNVQRHTPPLPGWCRQSPQSPTAQVLSWDSDSLVELLHRVWERISQQPPKLRPALELLPERRLPRVLQGWPYDRQEMAEWLAKRGKQTQRTPLTMFVPPPEFLLEDAELEALASLTDGDIELLEFVCLLLCELKLVTRDSGRLSARGQGMDSFLCQPATEQRIRVARAYLSLLNWSELDVLLRTNAHLGLQRNTDFPFTYSQLRSQLLLLRHSILRFLATAGEEGWCTLADLNSALRTLWPSFFPVPQADDRDWTSRTSRLAWRLVWRQETHDLSPINAQDWQAAQGSFLRWMLQGPLLWLGFADLCLQEGELLALRLHGLADLLWDRPFAAPREHPPADQVVINEANWTIAVQPALAPPEIHAFLAAIARLEAVTPIQYTYRLDMRAAYAAFAQESLPKLLAEWKRIMPLPMPATMHKVLSDWWTGYGQVHLYEGLALLEVKDGVTLHELEASTSLKQHIIARLSPRLLVVRDKAVEALMSEFATKGYMPKEVW